MLKSNLRKMMGRNKSIIYTLNTENNIYLQDHIVDGKHCFPTDAYLELIYEACRSHFEFDAIAMDNIIISAPILAEVGENINVELCFTQYNDGFRFKLISNHNDQEKIHIRGEVVNRFSHDQVNPIAPMVNQAIIKKFDVTSFYKKESSIYLGNFYRSLQSLDFYHDYAVAAISNCQPNNQSPLNPSILSAALGSAISYSSHKVASDYFLPYKINGFKLFKPLSKSNYSCVVKLIQYEKDWVECQLQIVDDSGDISLEINKLRLQRIARNNASSREVAIIGMSCRFPKSKDIHAFWDVLTGAQDCIEEIPANRWSEFKEWYHPDPEHEGTAHTKYAGLVEDHDCFDPLFFNISPTEAELIDPQQRIFLEEAWSAIENAGYAPSSLANTKCGVYVGCTSGDYAHLLAKAGYDGDAQSFTGTSSSILAGRISYFLNLKGPSLAIDTACSSSLTAIHLAAESIRQGDNELAIAGGVNIFSTPLAQVLTSQTGMQSPDGRCYTFDKNANGTVFSEGCGVILLKSLSAAIKDGDAILGIIRGSGINQDGKTNGITAPSALSQEKLLTEVYEKYQINPDKISYVEAHGTGTVLGDPIEIQGLNGAFQKFTEQKGFCAIGSVKSNIGHASYAAGVAGLIKVLLCIKHQQLVPSIHYHEPNKHINFNESPFFVNRENRYWQTAGEDKRIAAVSSFGFNGSNAHVVIEEYIPEASKVNIQHESHIIPLSAKSDSALKRLASNLRRFLNEQMDITNIAYVLQVGRNVMDHRVIFAVKNIAELIEKLDLFLHNKVDGSEEHISGKNIDWKLLYGDTLPSRVHLPTYPFEKERYWVKLREPSIQEQNIESVIKLHIHQFLKIPLDQLNV
ncbi:MAG: hypothetical protein EPO11_09505, partial [Gammaproteobacteria bacterium]